MEHLRLPSGYRRFTEQQIERTSGTMENRLQLGPENGHAAPAVPSLDVQSELPAMIARFDALRAQFGLCEFPGSTADLITEAREERSENP